MGGAASDRRPKEQTDTIVQRRGSRPPKCDAGFQILTAAVMAAVMAAAVATIDRIAVIVFMSASPFVFPCCLGLQARRSGLPPWVDARA
jgi:hypothetical protein